MNQSSDTLHVHPIAIEDFDSVFQLTKQGLLPYVDAVFGWDDDFQRQRIRDDYDWSWMHWATQANERVGLLCYKRYEQAIHVHLIIVEETYQRQGLGEKIMQTVHKWAQDEQRDVTLSAFKLNERAVALYRKLGYDIEQEEEHFLLFRLPYAKFSSRVDIESELS